MRGVFRLATGVYALGVLIRLLQRRSGAVAESSIPAVPAHAHTAPEDVPDATAETPLPEERGDSDPDHTDERGMAVCPPDQEPVMYEWGAAVEDAPLARGGQPGRPSEIDHLPRERLFEMAQANGHRLEELITMSREDLIDTVAGIEQKDRSPVNPSDHDKITNRTPPPGGPP